MRMRGFTLLETIIYLALFSIIMTGAVASALAIGESGARADATALLLDEGLFVLQRLRDAVEHAETIEEPVRADTSSLLVMMNGGSETIYSEQDGRLVEGHGGEPHPLTAQRIKISNLVFAHEASTDHYLPSSIVVRFTLTVSDRHGMPVTRTFGQKLYPLHPL